MQAPKSGLKQNCLLAWTAVAQRRICAGAPQNMYQAPPPPQQQQHSVLAPTLLGAGAGLLGRHAAGRSPRGSRGRRLGRRLWWRSRCECSSETRDLFLLLSFACIERLHFRHSRQLGGTGLRRWRLPPEWLTPYPQSQTCSTLCQDAVNIDPALQSACALYWAQPGLHDQPWGQDMRGSCLAWGCSAPQTLVLPLVQSGDAVSCVR